MTFSINTILYRNASNIIDTFFEKYVKYRVLFCLKKMKSEYCIFH